MALKGSPIRRIETAPPPRYRPSRNVLMERSNPRGRDLRDNAGNPGRAGAGVSVGTNRPQPGGLVGPLPRIPGVVPRVGSNIITGSEGTRPVIGTVTVPTRMPSHQDLRPDIPSDVTIRTGPPQRVKPPSTRPPIDYNVPGIPIFQGNEVSVNIVSSIPILGPIQESEDMGAVTDLLTSLGTTYLDNRYGPTIQTGLPTYNQPQVNVGMGLPFIDVIPEPDACGTNMLWKPATKNCAGRWIKRSRRRRKRLATASDIRDLNSLKAVLGGGKALESWIATHG